MNITIKDFPVSVKLGYFAEEQREAQEVLVSLDAQLFDDGSAGKQDELQLTVDYGRLFALVEQLLQQKTFKLVEAVVWHLGENILRSFSGLKSVHVEVVKQKIPVIDTRGARVSVSHLFKRP